MKKEHIQTSKFDHPSKNKNREEAVGLSLSDEQKVELTTDMLKAGFPPAFVELTMELLDTREFVWAYCPDHRKKIQVDIPAWKPRLEALKFAMAYMRGKPTERKAITVDVNTTVRDLRELPDEQLAAIVEGEAREITREAGADV